MSGGDLPPSNSFSVAQQQTFLNHNAGNHFQSPLSHAAVAQSERTAIEQKDPYTAGVNSQPEGAYKTMNPATKGYQAPYPGQWPSSVSPGQQNYSDHSTAVNHSQSITSQAMDNSFGSVPMNTSLKRSPLADEHGSQLPASIPVYNGPVAGGTSLLQAFLNVGSQPATNVTPLPPPVGSAQRLSAPLSPGGALSNGPSSQHPLSVVSNSTQMGFSQPGSALTSVMSSQSSHPSLLQGAMGTPMQRQLNANLQQSQLGQNASPPQSSLPTGQDQGPPPQTSGMFPTSAPEGAQALSALHSKKSKRRVRRTDTGYPGKHNQQLGQNASPPQSSLPTGQDQGPPPQTSGMFPTSAPEGAQALSALHSKKSKRRVRRTDTGYPGKHNQQLGQSASPPQSSLPTGQDQGPPPQTSDDQFDENACLRQSTSLDSCGIVAAGKSKTFSNPFTTAASSDIHQLKDENIRLKHEKTRLEKERDDLLAQQENHERELREIQQEKDEIVKRKDNLQTYLRAELEISRTTAQQALEDLQRLENENNRLKLENNSLQTDLRAKEAQVRELETSLATAQRALEECQQIKEPCDWVIPRAEVQITNKCLGKGGWGKVVLGTFRGCKVAVKEIHELILSSYNRRLFEREMNIASKCRHPCLLQFIGATNDDGIPLFITELLETSLRALLEQRQLADTEIFIISLDVSLALNYLHNMKPSPILHRDVSSANVLLWRQGDQWRGKVSDYGTAKFVQQTMTEAPGAVIYSAPEAVSSKQTPKVDVYSFGVLLCEMCIRKMPDPEKREQQVVLVRNPGFRNLVRECLKADPAERPDMAQIIQNLKDVIRHTNCGNTRRQ